MKTEVKLKEGLNFREAVAIVVGRIIGSGIFRTPGPIFIAACGLDLSQNYELHEVPLAQLSVGLFFLAWIIGAVSTYLGALCYAELTALLPRSGGPYVYLKAAYPEFVTFLRGWAMFFVSETAAIVAVAIVFSEYSAVLLEQSTDFSLGRLARTGIALALIWTFTFSNCFGVVLSGLLQDILSFLKVSALLLMGLLFLGYGGESSHLQKHFWPEEWGWATVLGIGQAMRFTFFAYSGWEGATYVADEVRGARRKLPLSLFVGIGIVMLIYIIVNAGYVTQLGPAQIVVERRHIALGAMETVLGTAGILLLSAFVMLSTAGNVSTQILVKARTWYAMARDGLFFRPAARLHSRHCTPNAALFLQAGWASVLLFSSALFADSYETMIDFFSFTSTLFNMLTFTAVWILRHKMANAARSFRVPCLSLVLGLVLLIQISFLLITLYDRPVESLLGVGFTLSGIFYYVYKKKQAKSGISIHS